MIAHNMTRGAFHYIIHPTGNFRCEYSVLELVQIDSNLNKPVLVMLWTSNKRTINILPVFALSGS